MIKLQDTTRGYWSAFLSAFLKDERGQSTTEYILILSVVVMIAMKFRQTFSSRMGVMLQRLGEDMDKGMENPQ